MKTSYWRSNRCKKVYVWLCNWNNWILPLYPCFLKKRKGIRLVKNWVVGCWHGYLSCARCRLAYGLWPYGQWCHCHSPALASVKSRIGFTFLVKKTRKRQGWSNAKRVISSAKQKKQKEWANDLNDSECQNEIFRMAKQMVKERQDITGLNY